LLSSQRGRAQGKLEAYVASRGGVIITQGPLLSSDRVDISCGSGHEWNVEVGPLYLNKSWCPKCAGVNKGRAHEKVHAYVAKKGGVILTKGQLLSSGRVDVRCGCGYEWNVSVGALYNLQTWCPKCAGNFPRTLEDLRVVAEARGGKVLSESYTNVDATYEFECSLGHQFSNTFKHVESRGQWCPTCNRPTKSEEIARETFQQIFGVAFRKARPDWLRNSRGYKMELDGFSSEHQIAFEYQGIQHFKAFSLYKTDLPSRIEDDRRKAELCKEYGVKLVVLTYEQDYSEFSSSIKSQLENMAFDVSLYDFEAPINLDKAYIRDDRLKELKSLLEPKRIDVLSTKWLTVDTKYEFLCRVCGHIWKARGNSFFNSRSVSGCDRCNRALAGERNKLEIEQLHEFATSHRGVLLSSVYVRRNHNYQWQCEFGHVFIDNFNNMAFRSTFCLECKGRSRSEPLSIQQATEVLDKYEFDMESNYISKVKPLTVRCRNCKTVKKTSLKHLMDNEGACVKCNSLEHEKRAENVMKAAGFQPLESYNGMAKPWSSLCKTCGQISSPLPSNIQKGQGCFWCYRSKFKKD